MMMSAKIVLNFSLSNFSTKWRFFLDTDQPTTNLHVLTCIPGGGANSPQGQLLLSIETFS